MSPSARPTSERHTTPVTSRILYGLIYRSNRSNSPRFVKNFLSLIYRRCHVFEIVAHLSCPSERAGLEASFYLPIQGRTPRLTVRFGSGQETRATTPTGLILSLVRYESRACLSSWRAPPVSSLFIYVAMHDLGLVPSPVQRFMHGFRHHHGTMTPSRAAKRNRQIAFPFANIVRDQIRQQSFNAPQELSCLRKRAYIARHARVFPGILAQLGNEMRIRQEAHVKHQVGVSGNPVAVTETHEGHHHRPAVVFLKTLHDELTQFVNVELAGFDDHIR